MWYPCTMSPPSGPCDCGCGINVPPRDAQPIPEEDESCPRRSVESLQNLMEDHVKEGTTIGEFIDQYIMDPSQEAALRDFIEGSKK